LQRKPEFRAVAAELAEPQRHFSRHRRALGEDGVESLSRHPEKVRNLGARAAERRQISSRSNSPGCIAGNPVPVLGSIVNLVLQIDGDGIDAIPRQGDPPIPGHPASAVRPAADASRTRQAEFLRPGRGVECLQYAPDPSRRSARSTGPLVGLEKQLERPVAKTPYHPRKRDATKGKRQVSLDARCPSDRLTAPGRRQMGRDLGTAT
jgi:hypothetical protein